MEDILHLCSTLPCPPLRTLLHTLQPPTFGVTSSINVDHGHQGNGSADGGAQQHSGSDASDTSSVEFSEALGVMS